MRTMGYDDRCIIAALTAVGPYEDRVLDYLLSHFLPDQAQLELDKKAGRQAFVDNMVANGFDRKMVEEAVEHKGTNPNDVQMYIAEKMSENDLIEKAKLKSLGGDDQSNEDVEMQQAIAASLMSQNQLGTSSSGSGSGFLGSYSVERERVPGMPAGLFNAGAICYFNTFIQTYFAIPPIRKYILEMEGELIEALRVDMKDNSDHFKAEDCLKSAVEAKDYTDSDRKYLLYECTPKKEFPFSSYFNTTGLYSIFLLKNLN